MENFDPKTVCDIIKKVPNQWKNSNFKRFLEITEQNSVIKALKMIEKEEKKSDGVSSFNSRKNFKI